MGHCKATLQSLSIKPCLYCMLCLSPHVPIPNSPLKEKSGSWLHLHIDYLCLNNWGDAQIKFCKFLSSSAMTVKCQIAFVQVKYM